MYMFHPICLFMGLTTLQNISCSTLMHSFCFFIGSTAVQEVFFLRNIPSCLMLFPIDHCSGCLLFRASLLALRMLMILARICYVALLGRVSSPRRVCFSKIEQEVWTCEHRREKVGVKAFQIIGMLHICSDQDFTQRGSCRCILPSTSKAKGNDLILLFECVYEQIDGFIAKSWHTHLVAKDKEFHESIDVARDILPIRNRRDLLRVKPSVHIFENGWIFFRELHNARQSFSKRSVECDLKELRGLT